MSIVGRFWSALGEYSGDPLPALGRSVRGVRPGVEAANQVQQREDHDPDDVNEVPVQAGYVHILARRPTGWVTGRDDGQANQPEDTQSNVGAVKPVSVKNVLLNRLVS